jgi:hypothetical protein
MVVMPIITAPWEVEIGRSRTKDNWAKAEDLI